MTKFNYFRQIPENSFPEQHSSHLSRMENSRERCSQQGRIGHSRRENSRRREGRGSSKEWDFTHLIFAVVGSRTRLGSLAKGIAAFCHRTGRPRGKSFNPKQTFEMVDDFDHDVASLFKEKWGTLRPTVPLDSKLGSKWINTLRESTTWGKINHQDEKQNYLYDEMGSIIETRTGLEAIQEQADYTVWMVPALNLRPSESKDTPQSIELRSPRREILRCFECESETEHSFKTYESVEDDKYSGQPIWECDRCGSSRYGPSPPD